MQKRKNTLIIISLLLLAPSIASAVPSVVDFSGRLDRDEQPFEGNVSMIVSLYAEPDGAEPALWSERHDEVTVEDGFFHLMLGADPENSPPDGMLDLPELWLGVNIDDDPEMSPRLRLGTVPYAMQAQDASSLAGIGPDGFAAADHDHAGKYVAVGQSGSVTGTMIADGGVAAVDLANWGCASGQVIGWDAARPGWVCLTVSGSGATYSAGEGLRLVSGTFSVNSTTIEAWARNVCYDAPSELWGVLDDRYSATAHDHNDVYAVFAHLHDDRYATTTHAHSDLYSTLGHLHDDRYATTTHAHDDLYSALGHLHDDRYATTTHAHDDLYSALGHLHDDRYYTASIIDLMLTGKAEAGHDHDSEYYPMATMDALLAGKAPSVHDHDGIYLTPDTSFAGDVTGTAADLRLASGVVDNEALDDTTVFFGVRDATGTTAFEVTDGHPALQVVGSGGTLVQLDASLQRITISSPTATDADITSVFAGTGLSGGGTTGSVALEVDFTQVQARLNGSCSDGSFVQAIDALGNVVCGADADSGGTVMDVSAGTGLTGDTITRSGTIALDTTYIDQRYVNEAQAGAITAGMIADRTVGTNQLADFHCATGQVIGWDAAQANWICTSIPQPITYLAGAGLDLLAGTFSVKPDIIELWAKGVCYDSPSELWVALDDRYSEIAHDHDSRYYLTNTVDAMVALRAPMEHSHADAYLPIDTTFGGDVTGTADDLRVAPGAVDQTAIDDATVFVGVYDANGTLGFQATDGNPAIQVVGSGGTLVQLDASRNRITISSPEAGTGDVTSVSAGTGLAGGGESGDLVIAADFAQVQARLTGSCGDGTFLKGVSEIGTITCGSDANSGGTVTSVIAGTGLSGGTISTSGTLSVDPSAVQTRVTGTCVAGTYVRSIAENGTVTCQADQNSGGDVTAVLAGAGLIGGDSSGDVTLAVDSFAIQARVLGTCGPGFYLQSIDQDGTVSCGTDADSGGDVTAVTVGTGILGGGASGDVSVAVDTTTIQARVTGFCGAGNYVRAVAANGTVTCGTDANSGGTVTGVTAGTGLTGGTIATSGTMALDTAYTDARYWGLGGNAVTAGQVLGTTNNQDMVFLVNGVQAFRLQPVLNKTPNVIGGHASNAARAGVNGVTVAGGGMADSGVNLVSHNYGTIGGGAGNQAGDALNTSNEAIFATVSGGWFNKAKAIYASIGGGSENTASGDYGTIGGGLRNQAAGGAATVAGGNLNGASGTRASIGGGYSNDASGESSTVGGGADNTADANYATVGGGSSNEASASGGVVSGGSSNQVFGAHGTVGGGWMNQVGSAAALYGTVAGGHLNVASGDRASIGGGEENVASGLWSGVFAGWSNAASGTRASVVGGQGNTATGDYSLVGGGYLNETIGAYASIAGGRENDASDDYSTVGGGWGNWAGGLGATVPGGESCAATGDYGFAAGRRAKASHSGSFVWGDSSDLDVSSTAANQFIVRASGGVWMGTASATPAIPAGVFLNTSTGATLTAGGTWTNASDRDRKDHFATVDVQDVLERLAAMPVFTWSYRNEDPSITHMGPTAQDFFAAFGLGADERHIATIDADGVLIATVQALYERVQQQDARLQELERSQAMLLQRLEAMERRP